MAYDLDISGVDPFVSGDEEFGADPLDMLNVQGNDPLVGALMRRQVAHPAMMAQIRAQRASHLQSAALLEKMPQIVIPIDSGPTPIPASAGTQITVTPVSKVRISRLVVTQGVGQNFLINAIVVGRISMYGASGAVAADAFTPNSFAPPFEVPVVDAGTPIVVYVQNIDTVNAHRFVGYFSAIDLSLTLRGR